MSVPQLTLDACMEYAAYCVFTKDIDRRYTYVNQAFLDVWSATREDFLGKTTLEVFGSEEVPVAELEQRVLDSGEREESLVWYPPESNKRLFLSTRAPIRNTRNEIIGICTIARDVTHYVKVQKDLGESRGQLASIIESVPDCIWVKDKDLRFLHVNAAFEEFAGVARENIIGHTRSEVLPDLPEYVDEIDRRVLAGEVVEDRLTRPIANGKERHYLATRTPLRNNAGEIIGLCGVQKDITELIAAEETLRRASRIEAMATLAGGFTHDFNNLISVVLGNAQLLRMRLQDSDDDEARTQIDTVIRAAQRAGDLSQQMLDFARGRKSEPRRMNMQGILDDFIALAQQYAAPRIDVETDFETDLFYIDADPSQVGQVLLNLCINAVQAMPERGCLRLKTRNLMLGAGSKAVELGLKPGRYVCVSVQDTGVGMSPETLNRVFEPFFTTKAEGRGLGLSAAYGIVQNMKGTIRIQSELGKGSTFQVYLPAASEAAARPQEQLSEPEGGTEHILVVDDEPMVLAIIAKLLERYGYTVYRAESGERAIRIMRDYGKDIDMAMLDLEMAEMNGVETLRALRELQPKMKFMVCTGYDSGLAYESILNEGIDGFIRKPFRMEEMAPVVRRVLDS